MFTVYGSKNYMIVSRILTAISTFISLKTTWKKCIGIKTVHVYWMEKYCDMSICTYTFIQLCINIVRTILCAHRMLGCLTEYYSEYILDIFMDEINIWIHSWVKYVLFTHVGGPYPIGQRLK